MPEPAPSSVAPQASSDAPALFEAVYDRLKAMASRQLARGGPGTLDTTALVHEAFLRFEGPGKLSFEHTAQFFAYAARAMRHILVDRARARARQKSGGEWLRVTFTANADAQPALDNADQVLALDEALRQLEATDARAAQVVELRYFAGLPPAQVATILQLTRRTVDRDWRFARAFLHAALD
ncbi:MAG: ECF-type sigma factor [Dokdonella sp.]|nr:sigma-70 family RNA polymerase sigma factor [Dokdonella sp.]MCB1574899.1 sigma-70 family RNA polymerase sigma factor [Xanthomonadales bacterium]MCB1576573.1 sigma-70 family RNA polymerase sigma factor [Xanthomonadales bacterium]